MLEYFIVDLQQLVHPHNLFGLLLQNFIGMIKVFVLLLNNPGLLNYFSCSLLYFLFQANIDRFLKLFLFP